MTFLQGLRTGWLVLAIALAWPGSKVSAATNLYATQFEVAEGYDDDFTLDGQKGWLADGTGGNGLFTGGISGLGQNAYVGSFPPLNTNESQLLLWQPINFAPLTAKLPLVKFTVQMQIVDSTFENDQYDNFRWSIYNTAGHRLFSIDFDNYDYNTNGSKYVSYKLEDPAPLADPGVRFTNDATYTLTVTMNFLSNRWSATLNSALIATNQPIAVTNTLLNIGDIDAVWLIYNPPTPGDNYMVFDNYTITADAIALPPPPAPPTSRVQFLSRTLEGWSLLRVFSTNDSRWALDSTTNFSQWTALQTNTVSSGSFDVVDTTSAGAMRRFYRARLVP